ncbi:transposase, IS605 OrfB family, partial [mine drainage metagenome]
NWAIRRKDEARHADGTRLNAVALSREFTQLKAAPDTAWLAEMPRMPFDQTLRDFDKAWSNFFAGRAKRPRRKKFGAVKSARFTLDQRRARQVDREAGTVQLDGIGKVRFRVTEAMPGRLRSVTVSRDAAGRWFGSFTADGVPAPAAGEATAAIGIDLGLKDAAVISDGVASRKVAAPKHLAAQQQRLRRYQRSYCRQRDAAMVRQGLDLAKRIPKGTRIAVSNRMR